MISSSAIGDTLVILNDPRLEPLIRAAGDAEREAEIERLIVTFAQPLAARVLSRYARQVSGMGSHDVEDILSGVTFRMVVKLRAVAESADEAILQLESYVRALAFNAANHHLRGRYPQRTRVKNRIRYILTHDERLASWDSPAGRVAGLAAWPQSEEALAAITIDSQSFGRRDPTAAIVHLLRQVGRPVLVDALVDAAARLWNMVDLPAVDIEQAERASDADVTRLEDRDFLRILWSEIRLLPARQRRALLLNLRDGETVNAVALFVLTGIVAVEAIAAALEMSMDELSSIWNELPLDDLRIGGLMNVSRQQVINLRKSARQRLARRLLSRKK